MKFSIITINYNNKYGLEKTIKSVLSQTHAESEFIIVDGGSTDGGRDIIEQYKEHLAWWCSEPDKGVYHAMNKGIDHTTGDYIIFMNSGDVFYDVNVLNNVVSAHPTAAVLYGDWIRWHSNENETFMKAPQKVSLSFFFRGDNICHQAMFVRSDVQKEHKYDENYKILADWDLWQRLSLLGYTFQYLPITICRFDTNSGLSETLHDITKAERKIIRQQYNSVLFQVLQENKTMHYELMGIGSNFRRMFCIRLNHPVYNFFLKLSLSPMFIITKLLFKNENNCHPLP